MPIMLTSMDESRLPRPRPRQVADWLLVLFWAGLFAYAALGSAGWL
jgi:hypothetical protein